MLPITVNAMLEADLKTNISKINLKRAGICGNNLKSDDMLDVFIRVQLMLCSVR